MVVETRPKTDFGPILHFPTDRDYILLTGRANIPLAEKIGNLLDKPVYQAVEQYFADGEPKVQIPVNVRNKSVFIIQPTSPDVARNKMDLQAILNAAKLGSSRERIAVIPYFGYARQDRKPKSRTPITAKIAAKDIENSGATSMLSVDIHNEALQGFVDIPWDFVYATYSTVEPIKELGLRDPVVSSADINGFKIASSIAKRIGASGLAAVFKERDIDIANKSEALNMIGNVKGKDVLVPDDILDTGTTIVNAGKLIMERGARRLVGVVTHGLFSNDAFEKIVASPYERILVTDTIALPPHIAGHPKIQVIDISPLIARSIDCIYTGESLSGNVIN